MESKTLKTELGDCESDGEVTYTYCYGDCGSSSSLPDLNLDANGPFLRNTCKCCTGMGNSVLCSMLTYSRKCAVQYE